MPNIYFPEEAAKQYGVGKGIGGLVDRIARQRAERQRELEEAAKLKADKDETLKNLRESLSKEQWDQLPPEAQALFMSEGMDFSNPALQSVVEQAQSGEVPSALRSPEYKLSEGGRELANAKTKIRQSSGGGFWDFDQVAKAAGGAFSRAADIISRPAYGVMEGIDSAIDAVQNNDMGELLNADVLRALSGKQKTQGSDVLMNFFDIDEDEYDSLPAWAKVAIPIAGLAGDIALDPLTYTGAGLTSKLMKAGKAIDAAAVTRKFTKGEAATQLGKVATEAGEEISSDAARVLSEVITPAANQMLDDVGISGTRTLEELTAAGKARRKTPFQPQEITAQTAALGETAGIQAAGKAKTLEAAGRAAGTPEAERAIARAAGIQRRAKGEGLLPTADKLDSMKKRDLFNIAKQEGYIPANQSYSAITRQSLVSRIKSNPQYRADVVSRATKHEETAGKFREMMNDATKALGDSRMKDLTIDKTLAIKFQTPLGRKVWSTIELPGITKGVMRGLETLNKASKGRASDWAGKALRNFSRSAQLGKGLHAIERVAMHTAYGEVQPAMKSLSNMLSEVGLTDISKAEQDAIWRAIDRGTVDELSEAHQTIAVNLQKLWDTQAKERLDLGMLKNDELITDPNSGDNAFVPLYFKGRVPARIKREIREQRIKGFKLDQIFAEGGKYAKYERLIEKDLGKIATMATRDHAERMGRYALWKQANEQFFLDASKIADNTARNKAVYDARAAGFVPLTSVAKDIGTDDLHRLFGDLDVKNIYVPPELEEPLRRLTSWQYSDEDLSAMLDVYKRSMRAIKLSLTMANPGYHLRNLRGDVQLNIMDGVTDPRRYRQAARLLRTAGDVKYQGNLTDLPALTDEIAAARQANIGTQYQGFSVTPETAFKSSLDTTGMKTMRIGGVDMPMDEVLRHFNLSGGRTGWTQAEIDNSVGARGSRSAWQRSKARVAGWSEAREELPRLAHFIDKLDYRMKEAGISATDIQKNTPRFVEAMQKAGNDVRKFNIDYSDLTRTEEKIKNYAIPFYTWMKKNTALQLEMMATRPVFGAGWSHAVNETRAMMQRDPYGNEITPAWLDEALGVPVGRINNDFAAAGLGFLGLGGVPFLSDQPVGPMDNTLYMTPFGDSPFANALEPFEAVATLFDNTQAGGFEGFLRPGEAFKEAARFATNQLAPQFQIPIEQATGTSLYTGGSSNLSAGTLPSEVSPLFNVLNNAFITGNQGPEDFSRLWNWATGGNAQFVTPQMKAGEVARQSEDVDKIWSGMREDILEALGIDLEQKVKP